MRATEQEIAEIATRVPFSAQTVGSISATLHDWGGPWCASALVTDRVARFLAGVPLHPRDTLAAIIDLAGGPTYANAVREHREQAPAVIAACLKLAEHLLSLKLPGERAA